MFTGIADGVINDLNYNESADQDQVINNGFRQFWRSIVNF